MKQLTNLRVVEHNRVVERIRVEELNVGKVASEISASNVWRYLLPAIILVFHVLSTKKQSSYKQQYS